MLGWGEGGAIGPDVNPGVLPTHPPTRHPPTRGWWGGGGHARAMDHRAYNRYDTTQHDTTQWLTASRRSSFSGKAVRNLVGGSVANETGTRGTAGQAQHFP